MISLFGWLMLVTVGLALAATSDARICSLTRNTLILVAGTCVFALPVGTVLALVIAKTDVRGRRVASVVLAVLLVVPLYLQAAAWTAAFGQQGWWTLARLESRAPASAGKTPLIDGMRGAVLIHALAAIPWVTVIAAVALLAVEPELEEEALLDASSRQVFRLVTLRRAAPAVVVAGLWVVVMVAGEMTVTDLLSVRTYAEDIYDPFKFREPPLSMAAGTLVTATLVVAGLLACAELAPLAASASVRARWVLPLGRSRWLATGLMWSVLALLVCVPLGSLIYKGGVEVVQEGATRFRHWSATKCLAMIAYAPIEKRKELGWSLTIAALAALVALVMAMVAVWCARSSRLGRGVLLLWVAMALALPGPMLGKMVIWLLNRPSLAWWYDYTILPPWIAQTVKAFPLTAAIIWQALSSVSGDFVDSAQSEGASTSSALWRVVLPQRWPAVIAAFLAGFLVALGELAATILTVPPSMETLTVHVFNQLHYGAEDRVAGVCLFEIAVIVVVAMIVLWLMSRQSAKLSGERGRP